MSHHSPIYRCGFWLWTSDRMSCFQCNSLGQLRMKQVKWERPQLFLLNYCNQLRSSISRKKGTVHVALRKYQIIIRIYLQALHTVVVIVLLTFLFSFGYFLKVVIHPHFLNCSRPLRSRHSQELLRYTRNVPWNVQKKRLYSRLPRVPFAPRNMHNDNVTNLRQACLTRAKANQAYEPTQVHTHTEINKRRCKDQNKSFYPCALRFKQFLWILMLVLAF